MKQNQVIIAIVAVVVLAAGGAVAYNMSKSDDKPKAATQSESMDNMDKDTAKTSSTNTTAADTTTPAATTAVTIHNYAFDPEVIKVKVGDTVTWTNQDDIEHSVIADTQSSTAPNGPLLAKGKTYSFKFTKAGTYSYHCGPHPYMKGTVEVSE